MDNKPDTNHAERKRETTDKPATVGGDYIVISGSVGPAAVVGRGTLQANHIAGGDLTVNGTTITEGERQFADLLAELKELLIRARESGELSDSIAEQAISNLDSAAELVEKEKKPPKSKLLEKLSTAADVLEKAIDVLTPDQGPAKYLLQALPILAMLIQLATRLF